MTTIRNLFTDTFNHDSGVTEDPKKKARFNAHRLDNLEMFPLNNNILQRHSTYINLGSNHDANRYTVTHSDMTALEARSASIQSVEEQKAMKIQATLDGMKQDGDRPYTDADIQYGIPYRIIPQAPIGHITNNRVRYHTDMTLPHHLQNHMVKKMPPVPYVSTPAPISKAYVGNDSGYMTQERLEQKMRLIKSQWQTHPTYAYAKFGRAPDLKGYPESNPITKSIPVTIVTNPRTVSAKFSEGVHHFR